ncbi:MAG: hypothetical protein ACT4N4_05070, partial [Rhodospirillales bacterium]
MGDSRLAGGALRALGVVFAALAAASGTGAQTTADVEASRACVDVFTKKTSKEAEEAGNNYIRAMQARQKQAEADVQKAGDDRKNNELRLQTELEKAKKAAADAKAELSGILTAQPDEAGLQANRLKYAGELQRIKSLELLYQVKQDDYNAARGGTVSTEAQRALIRDLRAELERLKKQLDDADKDGVEQKLKETNAALSRKTFRAAELRAKIPALDIEETQAQRRLTQLREAHGRAQAALTELNKLIPELETCRDRRMAELDRDLGPLLAKLDGLLAQYESAVSAMETVAGQMRARCAAAKGTGAADADRLGAEADALAAAA